MSRPHCIIGFGLWLFAFAHGNDVRVTLVAPEPGAKWKHRILPNVDLEVGSGPNADLLRANPTSFIVCISGGTSAVCRKIDGGTLPEIDAYIVDGLAEITVW